MGGGGKGIFGKFFWFCVCYENEINLQIIWDKRGEWGKRGVFLSILARIVALYN